MIQIGGRSYELVHEHRNGWNVEVFRSRYSDILDKYDYIVGDWGYSQLRLKGFFRENHPKANKDTMYTSMADYINEYCNFGCAYFVLHKQLGKKSDGEQTNDAPVREEGAVAGELSERGEQSTGARGVEQAAREAGPERQAHSERTGRLEHRERGDSLDGDGSDQSERHQRPVRSDRQGRSERPDRSGRQERTERSDRNGRQDRADRPGRGERNGRSERGERAERLDRPEREERSHSRTPTDNSHRDPAGRGDSPASGTDRQERADKPQLHPERQERAERHPRERQGRPDKPSRSERGARPGTDRGSRPSADHGARPDRASAQANRPSADGRTDKSQVDKSRTHARDAREPVSANRAQGKDE
ncbi:YutD-like domain-containing protein [Paenibacillus sabuli]|uniref:YutD-like domain-containing protein n=1 Tax=Paenibacillus sabuli TaxID=2772509 RepID=UPI001CC2FEBF|nr:YutD-like domain-containing protein [Paenibacillus sabuli]